MISIINLNNVVEKELELEHQGFRRTRRWIGDASQVGDERMYQTKLNQVAIYKDKLNKIKRASEIAPSQQLRTSVLERFSKLFSTPRQPASSKT
jgi:hypothetical protein